MKTIDIECNLELIKLWKGIYNLEYGPLVERNSHDTWIYFRDSEAIVSLFRHILEKYDLEFTVEYGDNFLGKIRFDLPDNMTINLDSDSDIRIKSNSTNFISSYRASHYLATNIRNNRYSIPESLIEILIELNLGIPYDVSEWTHDDVLMFNMSL